MENGATVEEHINSAIATIGEKLSLRRFAVATKTDADAFGAYLHAGGRIGVLTVLSGTTEEAVAKTLLCTSLQSTLNTSLVTKFLLKKLSVSAKY